MLAVFIVNAVNHGLRDLPCSIIGQQRQPDHRPRREIEQRRNGQHRLRFLHRQQKLRQPVIPVAVHLCIGLHGGILRTLLCKLCTPAADLLRRIRYMCLRIIFPGKAAEYAVFLIQRIIEILKNK